MRTTSAAERATVAALRVGHFAKLEIQDSDGVYRDYTQYLRTDWFTGATISESIDSNTMSLNATLLKETGTLSLSPFRSDSLVNRNGAGSYATAIDLWRKWKLSVAVKPEGYPPTGSDWKEMCQGRIDRIDWSGDQIQITGRGEEAVLLDFWIDTQRSYGSVGGVPMETVLQSLLDDNLGAGAVALYTPVSPGYNLKPSPMDRGNLFPEMTAFADKAAMSLRYRYDSSDVNRLTLFKPDRTASPGDEVWTLGASEYTSLGKAGIDVSGVRNFIKLRFVDATLGDQAVIYPHMAGVGTVSCTAGVATFTNSQAGILQNGANIIVAGIPYTVSGFNGTTSCTLSTQVSDGVPAFAASSFTAHGTLSGTGTTTSIAEFGRRDMEIDLSFTSQVNDATHAQAMADAIGSDNEFPNVEQEFETLGFWFVQLHDYGKFLADGVHSDSDLYGAVTSISHEIANATIKSTIGVRGKPSSRYRMWKVLAQTTVPTRSGGIPRPKRSIPFDDGGTAAKSKDPAGIVLHQDVVDTRGFAINDHFNIGHHTLDDAANGLSRFAVTDIDGAGKAIIDFSQAHTNKTLDNIPDTATRFAAVQANADHTASNTAAAIANQGPLATVAAVTLSIGTCTATNNGVTGPPYNQLQITWSSTGMPTGTTFDVSYDNGVSGGSDSSNGNTGTSKTFSSVTFASTPGRGTVSIHAQYNGLTIASVVRSQIYAT